MFSPNTNNVIEADVYSDLNRRSYVATPTVDANGNPTEEGICPPNGNTIATGDNTHYYKAYPMTYIGGGQYSLTLNATNCGAYRVTARYRVFGQHQLVLVWAAGSLHRRDADPGAQHDDV